MLGIQIILFLPVAAMWTSSIDIIDHHQHLQQHMHGKPKMQHNIRASNTLTHHQKFFNLNAWVMVPEKLVLFDYIWASPSKGGVFRSGPMLLLVNIWTRLDEMV